MQVFRTLDEGGWDQIVVWLEASVVFWLSVLCWNCEVCANDTRLYILNFFLASFKVPISNLSTLLGLNFYVSVFSHNLLKYVITGLTFMTSAHHPSNATFYNTTCSFSRNLGVIFDSTICIHSISLTSSSQTHFPRLSLPFTQFHKQLKTRSFLYSYPPF